MRSRMNRAVELALLLLFSAISASSAAATVNRRRGDQPSLMSTNPDWRYKFSFTKNVNSQLTLDCPDADQIWIGWSHYGTRFIAGASAGSASASQHQHHMQQAAAAAAVSSSANNNNNKQNIELLHQQQYQSFPNENDCWMNFTEKIAEQCNGASSCDLSSQPTYIHKCGKLSDYLYVTYKCIRERDTLDVCTASRRVFQLRRTAAAAATANSRRRSSVQSGASGRRSSDVVSAFYLKSSDFPTEYSASLDCSCLISAPPSLPSQQQKQKQQKHQQQQQNEADTSALKLEVLWFALQDNDYLTMSSSPSSSSSASSSSDNESKQRNLTGWMNPTHELPLSGRHTLLRFVSDDALAYKGFWLRVAARRTCQSDWQLVGDMCVRVLDEPADWRAANQRCQQMSGHLVSIADVVADLKLTQHVQRAYPHVASYWIGLRKYADEQNRAKWMWSSSNATARLLYGDVSWWPWRRNLTSTAAAAAAAASESDTSQSAKNVGTESFNNCVIKRRNEDGYFATSCDPANRHSFICQAPALAAESSSSADNENDQSDAADDVIDVSGLSGAAAAATSSSSSNNDEVTLQCGPTAEVEAEYEKIRRFEAIGVNSIKNIVTPTPQPFAVPHTSSSQSSSSSSMAAAVKTIVDGDSKSKLSDPLFSVSSSTDKNQELDVRKSDDSPLLSASLAQPAAAAAEASHGATMTSATAKFNTNVLASIIAAIGGVILLINVGVLFLCRRNLKSFLKYKTSASSSSSSGSNSTVNCSKNTLGMGVDCSSSNSSSRSSSNGESPASSVLRGGVGSTNTTASTVALGARPVVLQNSLIQDYFDSFHTLMGGAKANSTMQFLHPGTAVRAQALNSGGGGGAATTAADDSLGAHESAQLFYNPPMSSSNTTTTSTAASSSSSSSSSSSGSVPFGRSVAATTAAAAAHSTLRQSQSAFKPFNRTGLDPQQQQQFLFDLQQQQQQQQHQQLNMMHKMKNVAAATAAADHQYDKMNHHNILQQQQQQHQQQLIGANSALVNDSAGQYAHTYECLDTLELPGRRALFNMHQQQQQQLTTLHRQPKLHHLQQQQQQQDMIDLNVNFNSNNINVASPSNSSSSGASSSHLLFKIDNQFVNLADLNQLNQMISMNNSGQQQQMQLQFQRQQVGAAANNSNFDSSLSSASATANNANNSGNMSELMIRMNSNSNGAGSWSPDSAYYSSIPTLTGYGGVNGAGVFSAQQHQQQIHQKMLINQFHMANAAMIGSPPLPAQSTSSSSHLV